jgi:hypothetical protein
MLAVDGLTVTVIDDPLPGSDAEPGLGVVVVVFAMPPHAHATSAKSSGSACTAERLSERFVECIGWTHLEMVFFLQAFSSFSGIKGYWTEV